MVRLLSTALILAVTLTAGAEDKKEKKADFDAKSLVGTWVYVAGTKYGEKVDAKTLEGEVIIAADKMTLKAPDMTHVVTYKIDAAKTPIQINMEGIEGAAKGFKAEGIIELKGSEMRLAYAFPGEKRPEKFESAKDSKVLLFTLKKK